MRIVPNKFLIALLGYFTGMVSVTSYASAPAINQTPPPPTPPPPGLPIDGGIVLLLSFGLLLAFYKYSNRQIIKKR